MNFKLRSTAVLALLLQLPVMLLALPAQADELDPINLLASINWQHDSNLFRVPNGTNMLAVAGSSHQADNITIPSVGIKVNKHYGLQTFQFDYNLNDYKYQNYKFLEFTATQYKAAWLWSLTPYLTGTVSADSNESPYGFNDYKNYKSLNINTVENRRFSADWSPHTPRKYRSYS